MKNEEYAVLVRPLPEEDGGGWVATVPDLPGCMSDGSTMQEAIENVGGAIESWKEACAENGRSVPAPGAARGEWRQRVPRTVHALLTEMARCEGVSLNMLVATVLAEYVGRNERVHVRPEPPENPPKAPRGSKRLELVPAE